MTIPIMHRCCCNGNTAILKALRSDSSVLVYYVVVGCLNNQQTIILGFINKGILYFEVAYEILEQQNGMYGDSKANIPHLEIKR